jgi:uncharacterized membrane protein YeaQ/YmgE (transglycosylase-associated protein family)
MGMLAWVMTGLALWHFTVFLPDRFWGGIVGAFVFALLGSALFGLIVSGFSIPGQDDTSIATPIEAVPGTLLALAACYLVGARRGNQPVPH